MALPRFRYENKVMTKMLHEVLADAKSVGIDFVSLAKLPIDTKVYRSSCGGRSLAMTFITSNNGYYNEGWANRKYKIVFSDKYAEKLTGQHGKTILMHELVHTLPKCFNHGMEFKTWARKINRLLPGYNVDTSCRGEEWEAVCEIMDGKRKDEPRKVINRNPIKTIDKSTVIVSKEIKLFVNSITMKNGNVKVVALKNALIKWIDEKDFEKVSQVKAYIPKSFEKAMGMAGMKKRAKAFANYKG